MLKRFLALFLMSTAAYGLDCFEPYIGVEVQGSNVKVADKYSTAAKKVIPGANFIVGLKHSEYLSVEAGTHLSKASKNSHSVMSTGLHVSTVGFFPIGNIRVLGGIGAVHLTHKFKGPGFSAKAQNLIPRFIGGFELAFTDSISLRTSAVYEQASLLDSDKILHKNSIHYTIGGLYFF